MGKVKFVARTQDDQEPIPGSGVDRQELAHRIGTLDIEERTIIPVLDALKGEAPKGTSVEAWKITENQTENLVAKREGNSKKSIGETRVD